MRKKLRVIYNDDSESINASEPPMGLNDFLAAAIEPLVGTHVDALFWCITPGVNVYLHDTKVGEFLGDGWEKFDDPYFWVRHENAKALIEKGHDPPGVLAEYGHKAGLAVFASMRMNDSHHQFLPGVSSGPSVSKFWRDHPEYRIGEEGLVMWDYSHPEVRQPRLDLIEEACEKYDIDGVELDFVRHPFYFKPSKVKESHGIMTDLVREARRIMNRIGKQKGRQLSLAVRVLPTFDLNRKIGLDVGTWLAERLIDILTAGTPYGSILNLPIEEFVGAAKGSECEVYAHIGPGPAWTQPPGRNAHITPEMYRAAAMNYWRAGVDGIYLFNFAGFADWRLLKELGDPSALSRLDKHYIVDRASDSNEIARYEARFIPEAQLPLTLKETSEAGQLIRFKIADDVEAEMADRVISRADLRIRMLNITSRDELIFKLNGESFSREEYAFIGDDHRHNGGYYWLEFPLKARHLRMGDNRLEVALRKKNPRIAAPMIVNDLEVVIEYNKQPFHISWTGTQRKTYGSYEEH